MAKKTKKTTLGQRANYQIAFALGLFILTAFLARDGKVATWEKSLFDFIHNWPEALTPLFLLITQAGNIYVLIILALVYLFKRHYHVVLKLLMTGTLAYLLAGIAKDLVGRARPLELLLDATYRDYLVRGPGFPSGHVALATAMGLSIGHYLPQKYRWTMAVLIAWVAISRIYLGVHAPLDTLGGFAIGVFAYTVFSTVKLTDLSDRIAKRRRGRKSF